MTGHRKLPDDDRIQWTKATSKFGKPFEYGVLKTTVESEEKSQAHVAQPNVWHPVNWPVIPPTNNWVPVGMPLAAYTQVQRYRTFVNPPGVFQFRFEFTNMGPYTYTFQDQDGDQFVVNTFVIGDYSFQFNSEQPNIVAVLWN